MAQQQTEERSSSDRRLVLGLLLGLAVGVAVGMIAGRTWQRVIGDSIVEAGVGVEDKEAEEEIRRLYDREHENLLRMDIEAQARFLPDDFVVTNPFNMFIDKQQVTERLRANIIKYSTYERQYDYFRRYGDIGIIVGGEKVVPTPDADRPDAGETVNRQFTEVWVLRDGGWQKIVRHASNITQP